MAIKTGLEKRDRRAKSAIVGIAERIEVVAVCEMAISLELIGDERIQVIKTVDRGKQRFEIHVHWKVSPPSDERWQRWCAFCVGVRRGFAIGFVRGKNEVSKNLPESLIQGS
jgi:hypothetical protein